MSPKKRLMDFVVRMSQADDDDIASVVDEHFAPECVSHFYFPFEKAKDPAEAAETFWRPLRQAFPDYEIRPGLLLEGDYEGRQHASMLGFVEGNFRQAFANVPPTGKFTLLRFGINVVFEGQRIASCFVMFDLIDLMRESGYYPLRPMPGSPMQWPFPPLSSVRHDEAVGERSLSIIREMQHGLPKGPAIVDRASAAAHHSPHWAKYMNWFGPAGIGSSRGMEGFRDSHGALFLRAFPDRRGLPRGQGARIDRAGHFCEIGDGRFAMTAGWLAMRGRHTGSQWLGLPPTGAEVEMRVADWYRIDAEWRIADNWVFIDIPHMLDQMGLDIVEDLPFAADPGLSRLP